jgi:hypothetical protein
MNYDQFEQETAYEMLISQGRFEDQVVVGERRYYYKVVYPVCISYNSRCNASKQ